MKKHNELSEDEFNKIREKIREEHNIETPSVYKCNLCGTRVNFTFILPFIKESGMCPDCFSNDTEDLDKLENQMKELKEKIEKLKGTKK